MVELKCKFCGKPCKNPNSLRNHERLCPKNPDRHYVSHTLGHTAWNKGLTKDTDERVKNSAKTLSENIKLGITKQYDHKSIWTEELRKKKSEEKKKFYAEHPEAHPNRKLANNHIKMSYPERIVFDWLNEKKLSFEHNKLIKTKTITRYADFYLKDYNLIIEVDGEFWHNKKIDEDKKKDLEAEEYGYTTLRIKAKDRIIDRLNNYFSSPTKIRWNSSAGRAAAS